MYALVDCNNFFVSCERVFNPKLWDKPTVVLSNNDGCVVARSQEVKDMGVPMGVPLFKIKDLVERKKINVFSSNFMLYGDMSRRVMDNLKEFSPEVEIYSIDEAFLKLKDEGTDYKKLGADIIYTIKKELGLPVSVGIAKTKTLAKIANEIAKEEKRFNALTDLSKISDSELNSKLKLLDIKDIWGVGFRSAEKLRGKGIYTALDFKLADRTWVKGMMNVTGERTWLELNGTPCFELHSNPSPKKGIASTRSFGIPITSLKKMEEAVSSYVSTAAMKLRRQKSVTSSVTVYIRTNKHSKTDSQYSRAAYIQLPFATDYTPMLIEYAVAGLKSIFKKGFKYKKAGVYFVGISPKGGEQKGLFSETNMNEIKQDSITEAVDKINYKWGKEVVKTAVQGFHQKWKVKSEMISQRYTTNWDEILRVDI